jgi:D-alanyl-D-alanine carboxypeptidase
MKSKDPVRLIAVVGMVLMLGALIWGPKRALAAPDASIIVHLNTGKVMYARSADATRYPASLTKMMTLYMLFDALASGKVRMDTRMGVSRHAAGQSPSKLGLRSGSTFRVRDAIPALVVKSANDVAVVVAEHLGGTESEFARDMTTKARALGMSNTRFRNAHGLPNRHQTTTARDMATLAAALIDDFPQYYHFFSRTSFSHAGRTYRTHNRLMRTYRGMDGLKTGFITASGFNLASSAKRNGHRLVAVVMGGNTADERNATMERILDRVFDRLPSAPTPWPVASPLRVPAPVQVAVASPTTVLPVPRARLLALSPVAADRDAPVLTVVRGEVTLIPPGAAVADERAAILLAELLPNEPYSIQVGAYSTRIASDRAVLRAASLLPELSVRRQAVMPGRRTDGAPIYRARFLGLSRDEAVAACTRLEQRGTPCFVMRSDLAG